MSLISLWLVAEITLKPARSRTALRMSAKAGSWDTTRILGAGEATAGFPFWFEKLTGLCHLKLKRASSCSLRAKIFFWVPPVVRGRQNLLFRGPATAAGTVFPWNSLMRRRGNGHLGDVSTCARIARLSSRGTQHDKLKAV